MDKDIFTTYDFVGETTIPLGSMLNKEVISPTSYNVVKDGHYFGVLKLASTWYMREAEKLTSRRMEGGKIYQGTNGI